MKRAENSSLRLVAHQIFAEKYRHLGIIKKIAPLDASVVSSAIFGVKTDSGTYCLKIPFYKKTKNAHRPDDEFRSWQLIAEIKQKLIESSVPLELHYPTDNGQYVDKEHGILFYVTKFYKADRFAGKNGEIKSGGKVLGRFHSKGLELINLRQDLVNKIKRMLYRDWMLEDSLRYVEDLEKKLCDKEMLECLPHCRELCDVLDMIREQYLIHVKPVIGLYTNIDQSIPKNELLVHNDFHPANILFHRSHREALMLDLEQMTIGPKMKCVAFSLCRFVHEGCRLKGISGIKQGTAAFVEGYTRENSLSDTEINSIPFWIRYYELEKTLRIIRIYIEEGLYPQSARKLLTHHIPLIKDAEAFSLN